MPNFKVVFKFDNDNTRTTLISADSKEELSGKIKNTSGWFEYTDVNRKTDYLIQLDNVTSVSILKVK
ncbi:hypothetical protein ABEQ78_10910 [Bacillus altitudinis]|uniref:hypothetical protein n=1 Tax=Bacillus TaxID=1386 RepID=UPI0006F6F67D|nr:MULTISPECIES: hypothetical protein [Bacillus]KQU08643.1 hypothetical protein ASG46_15685 [Bacillus sp. Leaf49]MCY7620210.1 hypothetical protein [Bacillus altitudinis]MDI6560544.1 hypothetical protein [Bacillus altitudinis]MED0850832.1 hypothetical protein [Bacillus altitudinis]WEZ71606.1 hypothetical protein P5623_01745 [Bacillus altitudinis]